MKYPASHLTPFLPTFPRKIARKRIEGAKNSASAPVLPLSTFRMNTCKSVSKQRTLSTSRMNTYAKTGGRGVLSLTCETFPGSVQATPLSSSNLTFNCRLSTSSVRVSPLSTAFTPNRLLSPLSTVFTYPHPGVGGPVTFKFKIHPLPTCAEREPCAKIATTRTAL